MNRIRRATGFHRIGAAAFIGGLALFAASAYFAFERQQCLDLMRHPKAEVLAGITSRGEGTNYLFSLWVWHDNAERSWLYTTVWGAVLTTAGGLTYALTGLRLRRLNGEFGGSGFWKYRHQAALALVAGLGVVAVVELISSYLEHNKHG